LRTLVAQKQGRRQTGFSQSHNQNFLAFEFQHSRFFLGLSRPLFLLCTDRGMAQDVSNAV
jgi:hypothetical protein